jgi:hypothetical protein
VHLKLGAEENEPSGEGTFTGREQRLGFSRCGATSEVTHNIFGLNRYLSVDQIDVHNNIGAGPRPHESPAPILPHPPNPRGRGRHNLSFVVPRNGREIVCDRLLWIATNIFGTLILPELRKPIRVNATPVSIAFADNAQTAAFAKCQRLRW